ncbi:hypothetical protein Leryth_027595 [Lithospermum erythrorhizon]|nr:hypothetical protein Leryth_027595 [Lithospermum erythrorhizon]
MMISLSFPTPSPTKFNPTTPSRHHKPNNFETLKHRLINQVKTGKTHEAISTLDHFITYHHQQNPQNLIHFYSFLLKSCIRTKRFNLGKLLHSKLEKTNLEFDTFLLNNLITIYSKSGDLGIAEQIFWSMGDEKRDLVSWSAMISCYARENGMELNAVLAFFDMVERDNAVFPNEFCFSAVIQACSNGEYGWIGVVIFGFVIKTGYFESDVNIGCSLIDLFAKGLGDLESARKVFDKIPHKNSVSWTLMITRFAQSGELQSAVELFLDMVSSGFVPDRFTYSSVLSACSELEELLLGQQVHSMVVKSGLSLDVCVGCSLVDMYAKCAVNGSMRDARTVFDQIPDHNIMSWTAIVTGYAQSGADYLEAIHLYNRMLEDEMKPNHITFSSLLKACCNLRTSDVGEQVHSHAIKFGLSSVNCVGNSLISMYAKSGRVEEARKCFEGLFEKNLVSYNAVVDGYIKNLDSNEAYELFNQIEDSGVAVDAFTFSSLLSGAASVGAICQGAAIWNLHFKFFMK